jgi:hypothetical protein
MAGFSERALGMAGETIGLATIAAWLGLVHSSAPQTRGDSDCRASHDCP